MKLSEAKHYLPFVQAAADGKVIQVLFKNTKNEWVDLVDDDDFNYWEVSRLRIKPTPKLRPWKPEEVPVGALLCYTHDQHKLSKGLLTHCNGAMVWTTFEPGIPKEIMRLSSFLYSLDHGKTWLPCGVITEE